MSRPNLYDVLIGAGLTVNPIAQWERRRRPGTWSPVGVMIHHTAGTNSLGIIVGGRSDLPGPLANLHIQKDAVVNLVSAGRCNHAGGGARAVLDRVRLDLAPTGAAADQGYPDGPSGNGWFYGVEPENLGNGRDPWPDRQVAAVVAAAAAICRHHGWSANRVVGHREWTRRKIDPRGLSMDAIRRAVAADMEPAPAPTPAPTTVATWEDDVPLTTIDVPVPTSPAGQPNAGCGWVLVPHSRDRIVGYTAPGLRPAVDGRYESAEVGFAADEGGTVVSVIGWAPGHVAHVRITVAA